MVYPGSDIDVHVVDHLAPWESHVVMVDSMEVGGVPDAGFEFYDELHVNDTRPAFRQTSKLVRSACSAGSTSCDAMIGDLLEARLRALPPVLSVQRHGHLHLEFLLQQHGALPRNVSLNFYRTDIEHAHRLGSMIRPGTLSTLVQIGFSTEKDWFGCLLPSPACGGAIRLIGMRRDRDIYLKWRSVVSFVGMRGISHVESDALAGNGHDLFSCCALTRTVHASTRCR